MKNQPASKPLQIGEISSKPRSKRRFAFGYFFEKRSGVTFRDLAEKYAPFLQEVYFP